MLVSAARSPVRRASSPRSGPTQTPSFDHASLSRSEAGRGERRLSFAAAARLSLRHDRHAARLHDADAMRAKKRDAMRKRRARLKAEAAAGAKAIRTAQKNPAAEPELKAEAEAMPTVAADDGLRERIAAAKTIEQIIELLAAARVLTDTAAAFILTRGAIAVASVIAGARKPGTLAAHQKRLRRSFSSV
jgi:hypothetical protein